ncbi:MAG: endonuclease/exonuclease/phosphatase family metal-dependent hydrolase [Bacteriovoracaceae bacterium]|jgi:endonuclease/exonuclease/phosphatase family metal-dependent hydrolase
MKLKILLWNLQDFFVFMDKYSGEDLDQLSEPKWQLLTTSFKTSKPLDKLLAIRDLIEKISPDICLFTEVGGKDSLDNFNQYFLKNEFNVLHHESNSDRGIDVGILTSKNLSIEIKDKFHKHKVFARGVHELRLKVNNRYLHILLTHLKSKLNLKGKDFEGRSQREAEVLKLCEIGEKIQSNADSSLIISGDLNGIIGQGSNEYELDHFAKKLGLQDVFEHLNRAIFDRSTYIYYNKQGTGNLMQLDYALISEELKPILNQNSKVLDFCGNERTNFPKDYKEKLKHPSDHYPVYFELDFI